MVIQFRLTLHWIIIIFGSLQTKTYSIGHWWNLGLLSYGAFRHSPAYLLSPRPLCLSVYGLSKSQTRLCQRYYDHMPVVSVGARIGIQECQRQFRWRLWNCTAMQTNSAFEPATRKGSREAAFAHAISSAGVVYAVARSCKDARLTSCGCSEAKRPEMLHRDWLWGGCGDNLDYAYRFAKGFIDVREKEKSYPRGSIQLSRMLMNLHNNRAGRQTVYKMAGVSCKCHGVSGSCSLRTCWQQLPTFSKIGMALVEQYDASIRVQFNRRGTKLRLSRGGSFSQLQYTSTVINSRWRRHRRGGGWRRKKPRFRRRPSPDLLVHLDVSPDFCQPNESNGVVGTQGRECFIGNINKTSTANCLLICCGRGYKTIRQEVSEKCQCRFIWCCEVICETCIRIRTVHLCN